MDFVAGGHFAAETMENKGLILAAVCMMVCGFGAKAGLFPLHAWLPIAHPVAPAPASAVLSGVVVKSGVLALIRTIFYVVGPEVVRGSFVQTVWMVLALLTIVMGSTRAFHENVLKKRLAYSTVSQLSYVLFGLSTLHPVGIAGALLHVLFHSVAKSLLFMGAGSIIHQSGKTQVSDLRGLGRQMPITFGCFTLGSLSLVGIPPFAGFFSKWYLANGALASEVSVFCWLGPVILLLSALLTAGYLFPIAVQGFLPGKSYDKNSFKKCEAELSMTIPMMILAALALLLGIFSSGIINFVLQLAAGLM
jgi:multicomponent Na+:H+ antiporter subunit D